VYAMYCVLEHVFVGLTVRNLPSFFPLLSSPPFNDCPLDDCALRRGIRFRTPPHALSRAKRYPEMTFPLPPCFGLNPSLTSFAPNVTRTAQPPILCATPPPSSSSPKCLASDLKFVVWAAFFLSNLTD